MTAVGQACRRAVRRTEFSSLWDMEHETHTGGYWRPAFLGEWQGLAPQISDFRADAKPFSSAGHVSLEKTGSALKRHPQTGSLHGGVSSCGWGQLRTPPLSLGCAIENG